MTETAPMPANPLEMWSQWHTAFIDEGMKTLRRLSRLPSLAQRAQRVRKGVSPSEIVYEEDRLKVLHYLSDSPPKYRTPVIFIFALVNRPYVLDLIEGKSVVSHFIRKGFDTYLVDWGEPTRADRFSTLDDYINGYMLNVVDYVRERSQSEQVNLLGYCMGGTMSTMFTSLHQRLVRTLTLMAAGIDFSTRQGLLNLWNDPKYFDVDQFVDTFGNVPAEYLQTSFQWLKPVQNLIEKPFTFFERLEDDRFIDEFLAMETWLNDNIAVPGEVFREFVKYLYQQNRLVKNQMPVGRHTINLKNITCPVLNLMASKDDLVPPAQSIPLTALVSSKDTRTMELQAGHIGLAVGSRAQRDLWPAATEWMAERSEPMEPVPGKPAPRRRKKK